MPKQLEDETITVLRAMASAVGVKVMMSDGKRELIKLIRETVDRKAALPIRMAISMPREEEGASHDNIRNALKPLIERGLILTFPDAASWHMERSRRADSGTMNMPLVSIVRCAEAMFR